jgi:hypothetical protein
VSTSGFPAHVDLGFVSTAIDGAEPAAHGTGKILSFPNSGMLCFAIVT